MWTNLVKWFLLSSLIHVLEGSQMLWKVNEFAPLERTVKTILESCYENDSSSNPILVLGVFNESIENSSVIRMNVSELNIFRNEHIYGRYDFKASRVVLLENSAERLHSNLVLLLETYWWNEMTSIFIIAKYQEGCEDFKTILNAFWSVHMINSIYICSESLNTSVLYTFNSMANWAPRPWERSEKLKDLNVFHQVFNKRIACKNLNFDKTRYLKGYEINIVEYSSDKAIEPLLTIISALNASFEFVHKINGHEIVKSLMDREAHITGFRSYLSSFPVGACFLSPYVRSKMIAVVKLKPEIPTSHKIFKLWSIPVLIAAAISLAFLLFILIAKNRSFGLAILDVTRLLTYTSIRTSDRSHAFRIYFTTMLIFMVISNGVFQGKIAAFLTTRERDRSIQTINELADLKYKMSTTGDLEWLNRKCPECKFKKASSQECIENVLNNTHHLCVIGEIIYHAKYSKLELDYIPEVPQNDLTAYECTRHWSLQKRFNHGLSRLFQTGVLDYWERRILDVAKQKSKAKEAERSSAQYRPIKLYKLTFAFQVLALGLLISAIVFIWEFIQGNYKIVRRYRPNSFTKEMILSLRYRRSVVLNGFFSKYPSTIRQNYMSHVEGISSLINYDTCCTEKLAVSVRKDAQTCTAKLQNSSKKL